MMQVQHCMYCELALKREGGDEREEKERERNKERERERKLET